MVEFIEHIPSQPSIGAGALAELCKNGILEIRKFKKLEIGN